MKLQAQHTDSHSLKYRNALDCTVRILKTEGVSQGESSSADGLFESYERVARSLVEVNNVPYIVPGKRILQRCNFVLCWCSS